MINIRKKQDRGRTQIAWLDSWHSFSFGDYYDSKNMGFGPLRVINEDFVNPAAGFPTHGHRDMEIITYVLEGALEHKDSLGTGSTIRPGDVQMMRAGKGIQHSEFNPSQTEAVHLLQIWILPEEKGLMPTYQQKSFDPAGREDKLQLIIAPEGAEGALEIRQDALVYAAKISGDGDVPFAMKAERKYWLQVARGSVSACGMDLEAGDALAVSGEFGDYSIKGKSAAEILLFDLPLV
jgi:hypothetical protein